MLKIIWGKFSPQGHRKYGKSDKGLHILRPSQEHQKQRKLAGKSLLHPSLSAARTERGREHNRGRQPSTRESKSSSTAESCTHQSARSQTRRVGKWQWPDEGKFFIAERNKGKLGSQHGILTHFSFYTDLPFPLWNFLEKIYLAF